jgi:hypothetical protein
MCLVGNYMRKDQVESNLYSRLQEPFARENYVATTQRVQGTGLFSQHLNTQLHFRDIYEYFLSELRLMISMLLLTG